MNKKIYTCMLWILYHCWNACLEIKGFKTFVLLSVGSHHPTSVYLSRLHEAMNFMLNSKSNIIYLYEFDNISWALVSSFFLLLFVWGGVVVLKIFLFLFTLLNTWKAQLDSIWKQKDDFCISWLLHNHSTAQFIIQSGWGRRERNLIN